MIEVKLPELAEGVNNAILSMWHYTEGDSIKQDEDLAEFVTDKATFNMPSPAAGRIKQLMFSEGERVNVGDVIAVIE